MSNPQEVSLFTEKAKQLIGGTIHYSNGGNGSELRGPIAKVEPKNRGEYEFLEVTCEWIAKRSPSSRKWVLCESNVIEVPLGESALIMDDSPKIAAVWGMAWLSTNSYRLSPKPKNKLRRPVVIAKAA